MECKNARGAILLQILSIIMCKRGRQQLKCPLKLCFICYLKQTFMHTSILSRFDLINWLQHKYFTAKTRQHGSDSIAFFLFQTTQGVKMAKHKSKQNKWEGKGERMGNSHS